LRYPDGTKITYDAPGAGIGPELGTFGAFAASLSAAGEIGGTYADANNGYHGYIRHANGRFVEIDVAGAGTDSANGTDFGGLNFWYVRFANGAIEAFQAPAPNDQGALVGGINIWNQFRGFGFDANGTAHGFVAQAVP
jgi:hypothetical protein